MGWTMILPSTCFIDVSNSNSGNNSGISNCLIIFADSKAKLLFVVCLNGCFDCFVTQSLRTTKSFREYHRCRYSIVVLQVIASSECGRICRMINSSRCLPKETRQRSRFDVCVLFV